MERWGMGVWLGTGTHSALQLCSTRTRTRKRGVQNRNCLAGTWGTTPAQFVPGLQQSIQLQSR